MTHSQPRRQYTKSSRSGGSGGNCVEWAFAPHGVYIRDSKDPAGPELFATFIEWSHLLAAAATGGEHPWITRTPAGVFLQRGGSQLRFTLDEWAAFAEGVRAGEGELVAV
jgi:Domain of unknown function (DUF397)